ncbi:AAA family ATPase [Paracoccus sp. pheM1]|uniref:AAA family ATPase n=1 Tax=Paracoccus sp. pheM1 TaxID=2831675 RepID=UPI001BDB785F|nr:AAA family ATPase [Paracoccus sp. pheM1]MBT0780844.1 AAA family ATPase [Paracoccus sp. pheM1]
MPLIPIACFSFPDPAFTAGPIEERLRRYLLQILMAKEKDDRFSPPGQPPEEWSELDLPLAKTRRIRQRAADIAACHANRSPVSRLRPEDQKRLTPIKAGVRGVNIPSEHRADEIAAALQDEYPWMSQANDKIWHAMRRSVRHGDPAFRMPPMVLSGPPGIAKTHLGSTLGEKIGVPSLIYESTSQGASFGLVGSQKGWSNAEPGQLIDMLLTERVANLVVVVDELEKAGSVMSSKGHVFDLAASLLPLLEPMSAQRWTCPYFKLPFNLSWINWIITVNDHRSLSAPLLSRCPPVLVSYPTREHFVRFASREGRRRELSDISIEAIGEALTWAMKKGHQPDLRVVLRMLDLAEDLENRPTLH